LNLIEDVSLPLPIESTFQFIDFEMFTRGFERQGMSKYSQSRLSRYTFLSPQQICHFILKMVRGQLRRSLNVERTPQRQRDNEEVERRRRERGERFVATARRLTEVARQSGLAANRTTFLNFERQVVENSQNQIPRPDRVALRYKDALICWFCDHPNWTEYVLGTTTVPVESSVPEAVPEPTFEFRFDNDEDNYEFGYGFPEFDWL
jgi:hypothetical protein